MSSTHDSELVERSPERIKDQVLTGNHRVSSHLDLWASSLRAIEIKPKVVCVHMDSAFQFRIFQSLTQHVQPDKAREPLTISAQGGALPRRFVTRYKSGEAFSPNGSHPLPLQQAIEPLASFPAPNGSVY